MNIELQFRTHTGELVTGQRLQEALKIVADDMREAAWQIREQDLYASHVTIEQKDENFNKAIESASLMEQGIGINNFWAWQRIDTVLTGECVAMLPKY